jgi:hypothetical protein
MKRVITAVGVAMVFLCAASVVAAEPRDAVERSQRLDTDAIRDDVRIHRLQIPEHPLSAVQAPQPTLSSKGKAKSKKAGAGGAAN